MSTNANILIYGAGAVGSLLGAHLRLGGARVSLLGRRGHLDAIGRSGLAVIDTTQTWKSATARDFAELFTSPAECQTHSYDLVVVTTRTTDTAAAARELGRLLRGADSLVLSVQNGLGNWEALAGAVGWERVIGGVLNTGVDIPHPGAARVTVQGFPLMLGAPPHYDAPRAEQVLRVADLFRAGGAPVAMPSDIRGVQWRKLLYNCALNAPATVRGGKYSVLLGDPSARADQESILREGFAIADALGVAVDIPTVTAYRSWFFDDVFPRTADHYPSMLSHLRAGKPTEIDALNGALVRLGRDLALPTPVNSLYTERVRALEHSHAGPGSG